MGGTTTSQNNGNGKKLLWASKRNRRNFRFVSDIDTFLQPRRRSIWIFTKAMLWLILPSLGAAFILFYLANNPPTGVADREAGDLVNTDGDPISSRKASASWWLLFIGVRQVITFSIARFMEAFVVDFLCLEHRWSLPCFGPTVTLLSKYSIVGSVYCLIFFLSNGISHLRVQSFNRKAGPVSYFSGPSLTWVCFVVTILSPLTGDTGKTGWIFSTSRTPAET